VGRTISILPEFDDEVDEDSFGFGHSGDFEPPSDEDIDDQTSPMLRRQRLFRWAAQGARL
jgi:hypothetical protein